MIKDLKELKLMRKETPMKQKKLLKQKKHLK
jgi:hypothetical protein